MSKEGISVTGNSLKADCGKGSFVSSLWSCNNLETTMSLRGYVCPNVGCVKRILANWFWKQILISSCCIWVYLITNTTMNLNTINNVAAFQIVNSNTNSNIPFVSIQIQIQIQIK